MKSSKYHINSKKLQDPYLEKDLQGKLCRWLKDGNMFNHVAEVKLVTGGTLNFKKFEDQQIPSLIEAYTGGRYYKLNDGFRDSKPFDYSCWKGIDAYVACQFYKKIQQEICYFLHIKHVIKHLKLERAALKESDFIKDGFAINLAKYK